MSHTNATANYELSQFLGSDKPAWLTDYNGDMLKIDTALNNNADAIATNAQDIDDIEAAIGAEGLDGRLTTAENAINDIEVLLGDTELPTTAQSVTGAIAELKNVNDNQTTAIGENANEIQRVAGTIEGVAQVAYTIAEVYDSTDTYAVGDYVIYQGTLYKCTTAINVGESFDPAKWTSVKVMDEIPSGGGGTSYTAGDGIDITSDVISFDGDTAPYDNTISGLTATNVQAAIDEIANSSGSGVHNLDTKIDISSYSTVSNMYTVPEDGYVNLGTGSGSGTRNIYVVGNNFEVSHGMTVLQNSTAATNKKLLVFVKKGFKVFAPLL